MTDHTIAADDDGIRLDRWFKRHYPGFPHALLEKNLRKGVIRLDGKKAKTSDRVGEGQILGVRCQVTGVGEGNLTSATRHLTPDDSRQMERIVLYKDANLIVINKPFGLAVQGGTKVGKNIDAMLDALKFENAQRPKLVHRLDRDTSGVLVLARSAKAASRLADGFAGKAIEKTYLALVHNVPQPLSGFVELPLLKAAQGDRELVGVDEEEGKYAKTEYRVIDALARKFALVELKPLTGRMHQLRVHMAAIGCPIVGDHKYGGGLKFVGNNISALGVQDVLHLHARRIVIPANLTGDRTAVDVSAPLPPHMVKSFKALGIDVPKK